MSSLSSLLSSVVVVVVFFFWARFLAILAKTFFFLRRSYLKPWLLLQPELATNAAIDLGRLKNIFQDERLETNQKENPIDLALLVENENASGRDNSSGGARPRERARVENNVQ